MRPAQNHSFVLVGILIGFYWLLVIGYWLLVTGYWLLVIGYWLLLDTGLFWLFNRTGYLIVLVIESPIQSPELTKIRRYRNNRLKYLLEIGAPEVIVRNEKRMLQEA
ncbi:MAG: hypothetical protein JKY67_19330, partial [Pseudomonadales bacterium]|nr:hypothetical protein [Pseudomonadales bacterium]